MGRLRLLPRMKPASGPMPVPAPIRISGERPAVPDEGADRLARLQRQKLTRAEAAGMLAHHDLDESVAPSGRQRVEARQVRTLGQNAEEITGLKPAKPPTCQPLQKRRLG